MKFVNVDCPRIAIENPVGYCNTHYRSADQIIHPYMFAPSMDDGDYVQKRTCLWLKGLKPLERTNDFPKPDNGKLFGYTPSGRAYCWESKLDRSGGAAKARSKTFPGIARAMAEQWG